ncbi:helical backbone metal receptor [Novosphingobium sp. fls2-241-R2A-195]|uniref:ABC transporter substrate-binding protein n=1 Tax=Novosphingobium sp. fls2-241-R2A-195 TaxID=3040296 RepID=UPI00254BE287|nr:helical backbone metal receptor [Novosphingobium sp. fls2-241-R2A-195]
MLRCARNDGGGGAQAGFGWLVVTALLLTLAACQPWSDPPVEGSVRPRIVSLNPCTDAVLAEVTSPGQLLAISHYSHDPSASSMDLARAAQFAEVSDAVEDVVALEPDVVVASSYTPPATAQALRDMGLEVVLEPLPADLPEALAQVRRLAKLAGNRSEGEELAGRMEAAVARAKPPTGVRPVQALLWESGGIVAGDHTLIADLMRRAGFANAAAARGLAQADYLPLERVVADPPRVVFTVGSPAGEEDRMLRHPALAKVRGMIRAPLDRSLIWCGGPTVPKALARFAQVRRSLDNPRSRGHLGPFDKLRVSGDEGNRTSSAHAELVEAPGTTADLHP